MTLIDATNSNTGPLKKKFDILGNLFISLLIEKIDTAYI